MNHNSKIQPRRSFIFTPGLKPEMFPKAIKSGTDMVCIELEDGIAPQDKENARNLALKLFQQKQENDAQLSQKGFQNGATSRLRTCGFDILRNLDFV